MRTALSKKSTGRRGERIDALPSRKKQARIGNLAKHPDEAC
jgi:hypothetical protein